jgi:hypothetical protein
MCTSAGENYCNYNTDPWGSVTSTAYECINDEWICVVGEPYETIAKQFASAYPPRQVSFNIEDDDDIFNAPQFQPGYWQSWTAGLNQNIQNTLAAHGIYWRP